MVYSRPGTHELFLLGCDFPRCYLWTCQLLGLALRLHKHTRKGSEIMIVKELQPGASRSCCREDGHPNNKINIKSREYNKSSYGYIY